MLGRGVADRLAEVPPESLFDRAVVDFARQADLFLLNLECCISERGEPWRDPAKPFHFRAPPAAVETLVGLGVDVVTLANNHALDYGEAAMLDTLGFLDRAGIAHVGAGADVESARAPSILERRGSRVAILGVSDHPSEFDSARGAPGVAFADLRRGVPGWLTASISSAAESADVALITPHWGPNMTPHPVPHVREAGRAFVEAGATLVAGHSAHVFHGVVRHILYDLGDYLDDYAVDPVFRNDLGLLWLVELDAGGPKRLEGLPLALDYCRTRAANREEAEWITGRFRELCGELETEVTVVDGYAIVEWD